MLVSSHRIPSRLIGAILASLVTLVTPPVLAACLPVASGEARVIPAAWPSEGSLRLSFLGHSSFLLETSGGASAITDYNGAIELPYLPDVATMNNAHRTHYTDSPDPAIAQVLRGWSDGIEPTLYDLQVKDLTIRNVPTNIRSVGGTRTNGNSIFVFEAAGLCVAHLGHLQHPLTETDVAELGVIDVLLAPVDGSYTIGLDGILEVIRQINPAVVLPMHYFGPAALGRFLNGITARGWQVDTRTDPRLDVDRTSLPYRSVIVLPGS